MTHRAPAATKANPAPASGGHPPSPPGGPARRSAPLDPGPPPTPPQADPLTVQFRLGDEVLMASMTRMPSGWRVEVEGESFEVAHSETLPASRIEVLWVSRGQQAMGAGKAHRAVKAPMAGRLVGLAVDAGQAVKAGDVLFVLEAMKMQNEVRSPSAGTVQSVRAAVGSALDAGTVVLELG